MKLEDVILWLFSLAGGLALCGARLGWMLFGTAPEPPEMGPAFEVWRRKRRWLIISELSALPAFATIAVLIGKMYKWPVEGVIILSMVLGALGFAFFLDALQTIVRRRLDLNQG